MSDWVSAKLKEVAKVVTGKTPQTSNSEYYGGDIPFVSPADLNESILIETKTYLTSSGADQVYRVPKNTVLVSCIGNLGKLAITSKEVCFNQQINGLIFDEQKIFPKYGFYFAQTLKPQLEKASSSTTLPIVNKSRFSDLEIKYPPLTEQRRIASILDQADELRQKRQQTIEKLDQLLQATFIDMFGDPVSNPKGWDKEKMDSLMTIVRGGSPRPIENFLGGTYPWIKIGDATKGDNLFITKTKQAITEEGLNKTRLLSEGSVICANCGVSLGFARILKIQGCIHDGWLAFQDINEEKIHKLFLLKALNSITQYFRDTAPDGTQPNLNTAIMKNFELIIPPMELQLKFITLVESIEKQKKLLDTSNTEISNLFKSLQNQAFSGNL